jgi:large subunit ribosomal protein L24
MQTQQKKFHVKKGDEVVIIAGSEKGKRGKILEVQRRHLRVIVEGAKLIKKHLRRSQQNPNGAIVEREGTIHLSNVMKAEEFDRRVAKRKPQAAA